MAKNKNDERIMALKERIEKQRALVKKTERFSPVTNCSLELDGVRYNLNVATGETLVYLRVKLNALLVSAEQLSLLDVCKVSGFRLDEWYADVVSKLNILNKNAEEARLRVMEKQLGELLSADKKTELQLAEIEAQLGE